MSNPKEIKRRILSIESVSKTTEAMKMISIVKLRKIKNFLKNVNIYSDYMECIISDFLSFDKKKIFGKHNFFIETGNKKLFIIFTSNRGLCGAFNSLIFEKVHSLFLKRDYLYNECIFFSIGKKGTDFLEKKYNMYEKNNNWTNKENDNNLEKISENIKIFIKKLILNFSDKKISYVYLIYNNLKKSFFQKVIVEKLLPLSITPNLKKEKKKINYIAEPSKKEIFDYLVPKFLHSKLLKTFLISSVSEHTSRMIAMHKSTENANDIKNDLILNYNKERQNIITKEILEIISGLESLS
ncbi:ATP synthase F1 subunit gamma [Blattabacterium cuenoti]|uniref:ATP synthase F1 subunit gamma n=1 Tax=Blattabacterium cuenoti TaxID=1653831 RepID=UPI00163BDC89|nr:ATP synthase F1 subunit gamma [Blattabacterium cuenoti]